MNPEQILELLKAAIESRNTLRPNASGSTYHLSADTISNSPIQIGDGLQLIQTIINGQFPQELRPLISLAASRVSLGAPPLAEPLAARSRIVEFLAQALEKTSWLALHGSIGEGKTHLAALAATHKTTLRAWIRFGDLGPKEGSALLSEALATMIQSHSASALQAARAVGNNGTVVLHELPRMTGAEPLCDQLTELARAFASEGARIISTSHYLLPTKVTGRSEIDEQRCPPFTDEEISELLIALGAPTKLLRSKILNLIHSISEGHAGLVVAIGRFLKKNDWEMSADAFEALLRGTHAGDLARETVQRLVETASPQARELIYRLRLVVGAFSEAEIHGLASISPVVEHPLEKLRDIEGLWVRETERGMWTLVPIIKKLSSDIHPETKKACHAELARLLFARQTLDYFEAQQALLHLHGAEDFLGIARLLALVYTELLRISETESISRSAEFWLGIDVPSELPPGMRLYLLGSKLAISTKAKLNTSSILPSLDAEISNAGPNESWALIYTVIANWGLHEFDPARAKRYLNTALRMLSSAKGPDGAPLTFPDNYDIGFLAWLNAGILITRDDLEQWLSSIETMDNSMLERILASPHAADAALTTANGPWMREAEDAHPNWAKADEVLQALIERSSQLRMGILWAAAIRARIIVLGEYQKELNKAVAYGQSALQQQLTPDQKFLITECIGRQYLYVGRRSDAAPWFEQALTNTNGRNFLTQQLHVSLCAAQAYDKDPIKALLHAEQAHQISLEWADIPLSQKVQVLGELVIARYRALGASTAFEPLENLIEFLLTSACEDMREWRVALVLASHTAMYLAGAARNDFQSVTGAGGGLTAPVQGMFVNPAEGLESRYQAFFRSGSAAMLAHYAHSLGREQAARRWSRIAVENSHELTSVERIAPLLGAPIKYLIVDNKFEEALQLAWDAGTTAPSTVQDDTSNAVASFGTFGLLPAALHVATISIHDRQSGADLARELVGLCRRPRDGSDALPAMKQRADAIEQAFLNDLSLKQIAESARECSGDDTNIIRAILYIGATIHCALTAEEALRCHLSYVIWMADLYRGDVILLERILGLFLKQFWHHKLRDSNAREELQRAEQLPGIERIRKILQIVVNAVGVTIATEYQTWLWKRTH